MTNRAEAYIADNEIYATYDKNIGNNRVGNIHNNTLYTNKCVWFNIDNNENNMYKYKKYDYRYEKLNRILK